MAQQSLPNESGSYYSYSVRFIDLNLSDVQIDRGNGSRFTSDEHCDLFVCFYFHLQRD